MWFVPTVAHCVSKYWACTPNNWRRKLHVRSRPRNRRVLGTLYRNLQLNYVLDILGNRSKSQAYKYVSSIQFLFVNMPSNTEILTSGACVTDVRFYTQSIGKLSGAFMELVYYGDCQKNRDRFLYQNFNPCSGSTSHPSKVFELSSSLARPSQDWVCNPSATLWLPLGKLSLTPKWTEWGHSWFEGGAQPV